MQRFFQAAVAVTIIFCAFLSSNVRAVEVVSSPPPSYKVDSPILITGYAFQGPKLYYVQLFNSSNEVVDITGWTVQYSISGVDGPITITGLNGLVKPGGYIVVGDKNIVPSADVRYELSPSVGTAIVNSIRLVPAAPYLDTVLSIKQDMNHMYWKRNISSSTGNYLSTFTAFTPDGSFMLYGNGFYDAPNSTVLQIAEILANPRTCSPLETSLDCSDYVKIYNPAQQSIDLSLFRMRIGYQGQTSSSANTFSLTGVLEPGHYVTMAKSADGRAISLTNSGSFVWLEDTYGVKRYDSTIVEYPDASADTKKGQAWAYDVGDGAWKWTSQPTFSDSPSVFPVAPAKTKVAVVSSAVPCKQGQYRSEETNRCRSIANDITTLAPCDDDEERNPATNRCRKLASLASAQLTPCKEGQERSPETNRCRNVAAGSPPKAAFGVQQVGETSKAFIGWWALGGLGIGALGYGVWEWRQEVLKLIQKLGTFFTSAK